MEFLELAESRYSLRKFDTKEVEDEKLEKILNAGRLAPTAVNYQPQRILVVREANAREKIKKCTNSHFNAPVILVICYDSNVSWKNPYNMFDAGPVDAAIVATHMMLEATELGLGTTFVTGFIAKTLIEEFHLPEHIKPVALLPLGYPAETAHPAKLHFQRLDLSETVFYDGFTEKN